MKVRLTLDVSDPARLHIGAFDRSDLDSRALAGREGIRGYVQRHVDALGEMAEALHMGPLTDNETKDAREAVTYLRANGRTDEEIRAWLLLQQARIQVATERIDSDRVFGQPHHGHD
jgi:hypothetical protein